MTRLALILGIWLTYVAAIRIGLNGVETLNEVISAH